MSEDKSTCKNVPIEGQTPKTIGTKGNLLEFNTELQTCTIGKQHLSKNLKISGDEVKFKNKYFKSLPKKAHCNMFEIEKWEDWFTIPYYYINNKYDKGTNSRENKGTYTVPTCYKPCENNSVVKNNKNECESINTFMRGKYKDFIPFDPFAIIAIIGTSIDINNKDPNAFYKNIGYIGSYSYHIDRLKKNNKNILPSDIRDDIIIKEGIIDEQLKGHNSIISSVNEAYAILRSYINNIDGESLTKDKNTIIKEKIIRDINKFYDLFDTRDDFYMNYLKKIKYTETPDFGNYQGARYAYYVARGMTDTDNLKKHFLSDPNLLFMFNYCCNLCFTNKYLFNERLKNYGILEQGTINDYIDPPIKNDIINTIKTEEYETSNININKEDIPAFSEYEYVFKYFRSVSILAPFILLLIVIFMSVYYCFDYKGYLGTTIMSINYLLIYIIVIGMNMMYYFAYYFIAIFGQLVVYPLNVIMLGSFNIAIFIFLLFIALLIDPLSGIGINMRPIAFELLDFIYITLVQLTTLIFQFIIIIFSYSLASIPVLTFILYTLYKITYEDLGILSDPNINFSPYKSGIMMIHFQMMRNEYFTSVISNHIKKVNNLG